jgi:ribosomal protection tetracycline resistance protein
VRVRDRLEFGDGERTVTAISVFERGSAVQRPCVSAGQIAKVWGLSNVRIGDTIGVPRKGAGHYFAPPSLETVVVPLRAADKGAMRVALEQLAEQDPLINLRQDDVRQETSVSLYGEVQKEVIQETLAADFGIEVEFRETTTICIERPTGTGAAVEVLFAKTKANVTGNSSPMSSNPFLATVGLRVDPAPIGSGIEFRLDVDVRLVPIYIYKTVDAFADQMGQYIRETLQEGIFGWQVTDCTVPMIDSGYRAPGSTAADFRKLTPLVLMSALKQARTVVCEPMHRFHLEIPVDTFGATAPVLARLLAVPQTQEMRGSAYALKGEIPAAHVQALRQQLAALTHGEGMLESAFECYRPVRAAPPTRLRTDLNPLDRKEYLLHVLRRVPGARP